MAQTRSFWKNGVMGFFDEDNNSDYRTGVWADCPMLAIGADPSLAYVFMEDFNDFQAITDANPPTLAGWTCTQEANTMGELTIAAGAGGILQIDTESTTQHDKLEVQQDVAHFKVAANKDIWFEARVYIDDTFDYVQSFLGLATLHTTIMPSGEMDNTDADYIGFTVETGASGVNFFRICKDTAELADTMGAAGTFEEDTWIRLGFHVDGTTGIHAFVNGVEIALTNVVYTGLPTTDALTVSWVCGTDGTNDPIGWLDWVRCVQLR